MQTLPTFLERGALHGFLPRQLWGPLSQQLFPLHQGPRSVVGGWGGFLDLHLVLLKEGPLKATTERAHTTSAVGEPWNITAAWWPGESEEIDGRNGWRGGEGEGERAEISYWTWCQDGRKNTHRVMNTSHDRSGGRGLSLFLQAEAFPTETTFIT